MPAPVRDEIGAPISHPAKQGSLAGLADPSDAMSAAAGYMQRRQWSQAVQALSDIPEDARDAAFVCQWNLCSNLESLAQHRPRVLERLLESPRTTNCQLVPTPDGAMSISQSLDGRPGVVLSPGANPTAAIAAMSKIVEPQVKQCRTLALCGVGDGQLVAYLCRDAQQPGLGMEQVVHLIEPHVEVLWHVLMIHDLNGAPGPIQAPRFHWWIGPDWQRQLAQGLADNMTMPPPEVPMGVSLVRESIEADLRKVIADMEKNEDRWNRRLERLYEDRSARHSATMIRAQGGRPPRVFFLTTRFSTVLQHSTRDLCSAFESLGWRTRMPIEPTGHDRHTRRSLLREMLDFEPDLVVQIDHLRHEHGRIFPAPLPFACWIQDDLPNLTRRQAGAKIGPRDFVLTSSQNVYVSDYGYPEAQCIHFTKQTRWNDLETPRNSQSQWMHDLSYVSNASQIPEQLVESVPDEMCRDPLLRDLATAVCRQVLQVYQQGGQLFAVGEVRKMIDDQATHRGIAWRDEDLAGPMAIRIFASLNNALYRQQALEWVADLARKHGWSLGLYGAGWENHPAFAEFACSSVDYGDDLADLTRRTKINLQIVPYSCIHQRLLDGLAAGGFFLIRRHPMDTLAGEFLEHARDSLDDTITNTAQWRQKLDDAGRAWLDDWLSRCDRYVDHRGADPVQTYRRHMHQGREYIYELFPTYEKIEFHDRPSLARCVENFIHDEAERNSILHAQRDFVKRNYTLEASVRRMLNTVADRLEEVSDA